MRTDDLSKVYLDYAATTPVDPRVLDVMMPFFSETFGNPSSIHHFGQRAETAVEIARNNLAELWNCDPEEVIFTSCGSESDNIALRGSAIAAKEEKGANHILISPVEHHAVSTTAAQLAKHYGFELEYLPVNEFGQVSVDKISEMIRPETAIVSIIYANNEIGSINPIAEIGKVCNDHGVLFHTDAVQAAAHLPMDIPSLNVDLVSVGAHKLYGPKGIGALYVKKGTNLLTTQTGGGQEFGIRAGTSNVAFIVGQTEAFRLAHIEAGRRHPKLIPLRDKLIREVLDKIPESRLTGHPEERLPNHASFVFRGVDGNELLMFLDMAGFACSSGSACKTGNPEPSEVLTAIGLERDWALGSLRVTLGVHTGEEDIHNFLNVLPEAVAKIRAAS